ncbi:MAG: hypothetical protein HEP71_01110 [Roseivirga sp.]|nr:hypothetical protein [Roseivirga sp.]
MKYLITFLLLLATFTSAAQLAIIQDKDGYTNVRADSSLKSDVLFRLIHGQVFYDNYDSPIPNPDWRPVTFSEGPSPGNCYNPPGKSGFMHSSRILYLRDIKSKLIGKISGEQVTLKNDSIEVGLSVTKVLSQPKAECLLGMDQGVGQPDNKVSSIIVCINNVPVSIPAEATSFLYQVDKNTIQGYVYQNLILITSGTNSAAGHYECVWVIKDGRYLKRFVYFGP